MKHFKITAVLLGFIIIAASLFGCGFMKKNSDLDKEMSAIIQNTKFDVSSDYKGELVIARNMESGEITNLKAFIDTFKVKYPNIKVTEQEYPSANYVTTLQSENAAANNSGNYKNMFDVFWTAENEMPSYVTLDMLMPLDYFDREDDSFSTDGLVDSMVADSSLDGHMYVMPRDYNQLVMYYNKDLFDAANVAVPSSTESMSTEQFASMLESLQTYLTAQGDANYYSLDAYWNWESLLWPYVKSFGSELITKNDGKTVCNYQSDATLEAYTKLKEMQIARYIPNAGNSAMGLFGMGNAALGIHSRAVLTSLLDANVVKNIGVAPLPQFGKEYYIGAGCSGYGMYRHAPHTTEAWLFLKHIVSQEGQEEFGKTGNGVPVLKSALADKNASWCTFTHANLVNEFDHNAYVYAMGTDAVTSTRDYKQYLAPAQIYKVKTEFQNSVQYILNYTGVDNYLDKDAGIPYYIKLAQNKIAATLKKDVK